MQKKGNQQPTRSRFLPFKKSRGAQAVKLYGLTGRKAQTWQRSLLRNIMAVDKDGLWVHQKVGYSLPRRNGKNEVITMREFWGLENGEAIFHTAHRTTTSHTAWERLVKLLTLAGYVELGRLKKDEIPPEKSFRTTKQYGLESITLTNGGTANFRTRTNSGGLGEGYDLLIIDEAQEYTLEQESTLTYVVSDSPNPQTILCGTPPTMVSSGTVFADMREAILAGNDEDNGWAEWGVDAEPEDIRDTSLWYLTNPSLGSILTERKIKAEIGQDKMDFVIQRLGFWFKYNLKSDIPKAIWEAMAVEELPELTGKLYAGVKYGADDQNVALSIAVRTVEGEIFVECIDCRPISEGDSWLITWLQGMDIDKVVIDGKNGQDTLFNELISVGIKEKNIILPKVHEYINAMSMFEKAIHDDMIRHRNQPSLTESVSNCQKRSIGSKGGFGYSALNNTNDIVLLDTVALALWACSTVKPKKKQRIRY